MSDAGQVNHWLHQLVEEQIRANIWGILLPSNLSQSVYWVRMERESCNCSQRKALFALDWITHLRCLKFQQTKKTLKQWVLEIKFWSPQEKLDSEATSVTTPHKRVIIIASTPRYNGCPICSQVSNWGAQHKHRPRIFRGLRRELHLFQWSSIHWTTVFSIGRQHSLLVLVPTLCKI